MGNIRDRHKFKKGIGKRMLYAWLALEIVLTSVDFTVLAQEKQVEAQKESKSTVSETIENSKEIAEKEEVPRDDTADGEDLESERDNPEAGEEQNKVENPEGEEKPKESENPDREIDDELEKPEDSVKEEEDGLGKESDIIQEDQEKLEQVGDESDELAGEESAEDSGKCGDNLIWTLKDGTLTISGTGEMWDYSYTNESPAVWREAEYLILCEGITSIGSYAFDGVKHFKGDLVIPEGVTSIGDFAFSDCLVYGYEGNLVIPNSVTYIGDSAFYNCLRFTGNLIIPENVTYMRALKKSDSLKKNWAFFRAGIIIEV